MAALSCAQLLALWEQGARRHPLDRALLLFAQAAPERTPESLADAPLGACNAALLKANQCGTLTELIAAARATRALGWNAIQSGRSGESEDVSLSHLAVGLGSEQIKVGSIARSERTAKWNEVIRIEESSLQYCWQFTLPS